MSDDVYFSGDAKEHGAARRTDPETSHDAAESIDPTSMYGIIIDLLVKARTGLTTHEMAPLCGIGYQTITPRIRPMRLRGWVYGTGRKRPWKGSPGNPATDRDSMVWQLTRLRDSPEELRECEKERLAKASAEGQKKKAPGRRKRKTGASASANGAGE